MNISVMKKKKKNYFQKKDPKNGFIKESKRFITVFVVATPING